MQKGCTISRNPIKTRVSEGLDTPPHHTFDISRKLLEFLVMSQHFNEIVLLLREWGCLFWYSHLKIALASLRKLRGYQGDGFL
jgi:hypothetical protein